MSLLDILLDDLFIKVIRILFIISAVLSSYIFRNYCISISFLAGYSTEIILHTSRALEPVDMLC